MKARYQDVEVTDATSPDFTEAEIIKYESLSWADDLDDAVQEAYDKWEQSHKLVAVSYMDEIIWFITEDGHMYDKDMSGYYLEGFFVGGVEIHLEPSGHYEIWT